MFYYGKSARVQAFFLKYGKCILLPSILIKPNVICVQVTWLKHHLGFILQGYVIICPDRKEGIGGGCATFVELE